MPKSKRIYNEFWKEAAPLKALITKLENYWIKVGNKEFIKGMDGSKIITRSRHALLNSLLQSAGAICAKRHMVIFDRKVKEAGYSIDYFKDDWTEKSYINQLVAYHDELQVQATKDLVEHYNFKTKEEAEEYRKEHGHSSEVMEQDGEFVVAESIAGKFLQEAAKETSEYYKMNVELKMDWAANYNWAGTH